MGGSGLTDSFFPDLMTKLHGCPIRIRGAEGSFIAFGKVYAIGLAPRH